MNLEQLELFRPDHPKSPAARAKKEEWAPPTRADLAEGKVIAIDQTLAHTGIVAMTHDRQGLIVRGTASWMIGAPDGATGHEDSLQRTLMLRKLLDGFCRDYGTTGWVVRHELPIPLKTNPKINRPESALLAAVAVRVVAYDQHLPVAAMMGAQTHKRITCGKPNADKPTHHHHLELLAVELGIQGWGKVTNEGKRDAASIAIAHLYQEKTGG